MGDSLKKYSDIEVERGVLPESLTFDESKAEDLDAYPIKVVLQHLTDEEANPDQHAATNGTATSDGLFRSNMAADDTQELLKKASTNGKAGTRETVKAKYMIGCDGAHSWTRNQLGYKLEGEQTDYIWGVLDIIPITDFPDIRMRCAIHSASSGSVMVIPRENKLVRLYIQMTTTEKGGNKLDRKSITPQLILESAQRTLAPYKLNYEYCDWWTAYQIGQRVGSNFSKIFNGQADGLQCRTLEIFDSFGFADRAWKESNHMLEICLWNPDSEGRIRRSDRIPDTIPNISRFQQVVLHQGSPSYPVASSVSSSTRSRNTATSKSNVESFPNL